MEEARQKNSQDLAKNLEMLEEWKKLWKKKIIQSYENIFFHFQKNIGRMEEARQKNSQDLAKTLEMLEEWKKLWKKKIIQSYNKYFLSFSKKFWKNGRS